MSLKRDVWILPLLRSRQVGAFLRALAPHFGLLAAQDVRLRFDQAGNLLVICPLVAGGQAAGLKARLAEAFEAAGRSASELENMPAQSRRIDGDLELFSAILAHIRSYAARAAVPADSADADTSETLAPRRIRALQTTADRQDWPAGFAALVRRSSEARVLIGPDGVSILDLGDDPGRGSTLAGLRAAGLPPGLHLFGRHLLGMVPVWLPEGEAFQDEDRPYLTALIAGLIDAGKLANGAEIYLFGVRDGEIRAAITQPDPSAAQSLSEASTPFIHAGALAVRTDPPETADELGPALRFRLYEPRPDAEAQAELNHRINERSFPLGYRIRLSAVAAAERGDENIERLRSQIEELEAQIALIQALGRRQQRLLRFTDRQLGALIDGLRKMPRALRDNQGLRYCASYAADRDEPVHFVLYDPEVVQFEGVLPEYYWRAVTEDQPITFWLDPHAAELSQHDPEEPAVFVPDGHRILPYIDSFGGSVKGMLQLVLGRLFVDGSAVLDAPGAQPAFVFRDLKDGVNEIGVELLDLKRFEPLKLSLRWLNDHLLVSSPRTVRDEDRRELVETLYAGQLARDMRASMQSEVQALKDGWAQAQTDLLGCVDEMAAAVAREVAGLREQMRASRQFVDLTRTRLADVTSALNALGTAVGGLDPALETMARDLSGMARGRVAVFEQYLSEVVTSRQLMDDAEANIARLREQMERIAAGLEQR